MSKTVTVGISDLNVVKAPDVLVTYALGSCVGICIYDAVAQVAGMAHIMLPSSTLSPNTNIPYRFADTGTAALIQKMEALGASQPRMRAKIAGGAQMFAVSGNSSIANIGQRNIAAVRAALAKLRVSIVADHTGADFGRTVFFSAEDGSMRVKSAIKGEWML